ncbi:MAG: ABC transporter permease, partial [Candidatus Omnitrophica bacterium]|nr:ABC transporter permease [Candidatus Omnitrophota bacterium]
KVFKPSDADLMIQEVTGEKGIELSTERVFLEAPVVKAALKSGDSHTGILTYFVNEFRFGDKSCPYSMVAAVGSLGATHENEPRGPLLEALPRDLGDDEAVINQWLAEDLGLSVGDEFEVDYYVIGPLRTVEEKNTSFKVRKIVPIEGPFDDPDLMPGFPGLSEAEDCRNWEPGVPIDLTKIRDKDEVYWDDHRGTPKAFITLRKGEQLWRNRYGDLTAIRYPIGTVTTDSLSQTLSENIQPEVLGLRFVPVRDRAIAASTQAMDFGGLFIGFSFFLIVAALLFMGLMNVFGIEQRSEEVGTLLALGFVPKQIRRIFLLEGFLLTILGCVIGVLLGIAYGKIVVWGLSTVWSGATAGLQVYFSTNPTTLISSFFAGILISFITLWLTIRRQARIPARELLASGAEATLNRKRKKKTGVSWGWIIAAVLFIGGAGMAYEAGQDPSQASEFFFVAGSLFLLSGLSLAYAIFSKFSPGESLSLVTLSARNTTRRKGRSLIPVALLAAGSFLVIAVGANRHGAPEDMQVPSSGTGGFTLYGETTLPILHDLNTEKGAEAYALTLDDLKGADVVPMRFLEGDDASCLNLNRPQMPQVLGVNPEEFQKRGSFTFAQLLDKKYENEPWRILEEDREDGTVPAVADQNTVMWILHKALGDTLTYINGRGERVQVRIVGTLASSILQGNIIISEKHFIDKFPDVSGYRTFLVDAEPGTMKGVSKNLAFGLQDYGVRIDTTAEKLASFNVVENTYLSIFQSLGGLGMILGSLGLGVVVLRNVLERRGELALLRAVGFRYGQILKIVLFEHWWLVILGLVIGTLSGLVSVLPAIGSAHHPFPYVSLSLTLLGMVASCLIWTYLAAIFALRGPLLNALRNE